MFVLVAWPDLVYETLTIRTPPSVEEEDVRYGSPAIFVWLLISDHYALCMPDIVFVAVKQNVPSHLVQSINNWHQFTKSYLPKRFQDCFVSITVRSVAVPYF